MKPVYLSTGPPNSSHHMSLCPTGCAECESAACFSDIRKVACSSPAVDGTSRLM
jgi:hypothetical protein